MNIHKFLIIYEKKSEANTSLIILANGRAICNHGFYQKSKNGPLIHIPIMNAVFYF